MLLVDVCVSSLGIESFTSQSWTSSRVEHP